MIRLECHTRRLLFASTLLFLAHIPLLLIVRGEFTDGALQAVYFDDPIYVTTVGVGSAKYVPPLFPLTLYAVSSLGIDRMTAGRLVSMAAYALTAFGLGWIATRIGAGFGRDEAGGRKIGWMAFAFWALSPMANRWSYHCMSDMLFCCLATLSLGCFLEASRKAAQTPSRFWAAGNLLGCAASFCRYQGLALMVASAIAWFFLPAKRKNDERGERSIWEILSFGVWAVGSIALLSQAVIHGKQFSERSQFPMEVYTGFAVAAFRYLPYAVTPPLFLLAVGGTIHVFRIGGRARLWAILGVLGGVGGLIVQTLFQSFQFRYGLPLLPWVCLLGATGSVALPKKYRIPAVSIAAFGLGGMTFAVILCQHETFGDMEKAARAAGLAARASGGKAWACEPYDNEGKYRNVKTSVWSGVPVQWLDDSALEQVAKGDVLIQSNVYPIPDDYLTALRAKWRLAVIEEAVSETVPLFPGEILWVKYPTPQGVTALRGTSDPNLMPYRFKRQFYSTVVYGVEDKTTGP